MPKYVWKVVKKRNRNSCIVPRCKYQLKYEKGKVVKAKEGTLGIFCFKRKKDAINFNIKFQKLIKVKPIGRGKEIHFCSKTINIPKTFDIFYEKRFCVSIYTPTGTVCYPAVEVLE